MILSWQEITIINCSRLCYWTVADTASCSVRAICVLAPITHLTDPCKLLWDDCLRLFLKLLFPECRGPSQWCPSERSSSSNQDDRVCKTSTPQIKEFLKRFTVLLCLLVLLFCLKNHCRGALHVRYTLNATWDHGEGEKKSKTSLGERCLGSHQWRTQQCTSQKSCVQDGLVRSLRVTGRPRLI